MINNNNREEIKINKAKMFRSKSLMFMLFIFACKNDETRKTFFIIKSDGDKAFLLFKHQ